MTVGAELRDHHIGVKGSQKRCHPWGQGQKKELVVATGQKRNIDGVTNASTPPNLFDEAGAGEEAVTALMDGDGQHLFGIVKSELYPIPVLCINVDIGDAPAAANQVLDNDGSVVEVTEAGCPGRCRMMQSAGDIE